MSWVMKTPIMLNCITSSQMSYSLWRSWMAVKEHHTTMKPRRVVRSSSTRLMPSMPMLNFTPMLGIQSMLRAHCTAALPRSYWNQSGHAQEEVRHGEGQGPQLEGPATALGHEEQQEGPEEGEEVTHSGRFCYQGIMGTPARSKGRTGQ